MHITNGAIPRHAVLRSPRRRDVSTPRSRAWLRGSAGFTLVEVLLASLLGALVLMALTSAIDIHFRVYDSSRGNVEEAQLARALLGRIAEDLRGAIQYDPIKAEKLLSDTSSGSSGSSGSDNTGSSGGSDNTGSSGDPTATAGSSTDDSQSTDQSTSMSSTDLSASSLPMTVPGLYGNQNQLQVDVSRLPRIDQLEAMLQAADDSSALDRPSDVKTVTYYVNAPTSTTALAMGGNLDNGTGLIRRELDRAVTAFTSQQGDSSALDANLPPLAPEVNSIQFRYFDGSDWYDEWDSSSQSKLPTAVEVTVAITPVLRKNASPLSGLGSVASLDADPAHMYRLLVHLPGAQPPRTYGSSGSSDQSEDDSMDQSAQQSSPETASAAPPAPSPTPAPAPTPSPSPAPKR